MMQKSTESYAGLDQQPVSATPILGSGVVEPTTLLLLAKLGSMLVLGLGSLLLGMLPLLIGRYRVQKNARTKSTGYQIKNQINGQPVVGSASSVVNVDPPAANQGLVTSLLLCFGGGVLLFTTFLHLAPEVRESIEKHQETGRLVDLGSLSLADLLFCGGFFLVYFVEEAVHAALTKGPESSETLLYRTVSVRRCNNNNVMNNNNSANNNNNKKNNNEHKISRESSVIQQPPIQVWRTDSSDDAEDLDTRAVKTNSLFVVSSDEETKCPHDHRTGYISDDQMESGKLKLHDHQHDHHHHHHHQHQHQHQHHHHHTHADNSMRSLLTVLALSFHAIFEGLAVGLEPAFNSVLYLAAAIATHKLVISFCVGMELWVAGASKRAILGYLSVFAMVTPLGIGLGLGLGHFRNDSENLGATPTILQAMAAGTLLYVVFFEVLARERANDKSGLLQLAAIFMGFMLMLALQIITAHSHDHGGGHSHEDTAALGLSGAHSH